VELIHAHEGREYPGAKMLLNKARQRLALLKVEQNNLPEAGALFTTLLESPDWRQRTGLLTDPNGNATTFAYDLDNRLSWAWIVWRPLPSSGPMEPSTI